MMPLYFGLVYCSLGEEYNRATILSLMSFPGVPALILCEDTEFFERALSWRANTIIMAPSVPAEYVGYQRSRYLKWVSAPLLSPFQVSLMVDSDTIALENFQLPYPSTSAVAMVFDRMPKGPRMSEPEKIYTANLLPPNHFEHFEFNGGVILWRRSDEADYFFECCFREYMRFGDFEQPAIMRAIYGNRIPVESLPIALNYPSYLLDNQSIAVHQPQIVHCQGGQVKSGSFFKTAKAIAPIVFNQYEDLMRGIYASDR